MSDAFRLFKIHLMDMTGFNRALHYPDKSKRAGKMALAILIYVAIICIIPSAALYFYMMASGLSAVGALDQFPAAILSMMAIITLFATITKTNGVVVGFSDYDKIVSMPISKFNIAASRVMFLYAINGVIVAFIMLPAGAVYAYFARPAFEYYIYYLLALPFTPILPMIIGSALGAIVARVSSGMKSKQYVTLVLLAAITLGALWFTGRSDTELQSAMTDVGNTLGNMATRYYPLAGLYIDAVIRLSAVSLIAFISVSAALFAGFTWLLAANLSRLQDAMTSARAHGKYKLKSSSLRSKGVMKALYIKEFKRFTSSAIYMLNTGFGMLLAVAGAIMLRVSGTEMIAQMFDIPGVATAVAGYIPLALGIMTSTVNTTGSSISLEGKNLWLIKSLPVSAMSICASKMLVCLTVAVPPTWLAGAIALTAMPMNFAQIIMVFITPLAFACLIAISGLIFNLYVHRFDWTNEVTIIKQSLGAMIPMLLGLAVGIVPLVLSANIGIDITLMTIAATAFTALLDVIMYIFLRANAERLVKAL